MKCSVDGCFGEARALGLCRKHYARKYRHGDVGTVNRPENWGDHRRDSRYHIWGGIKKRCLNQNNHHYARYGGRGITVCREWAESFDKFCEDVGPRPSASHSLDRIENSKGYEPGNVRWATSSEQQSNRRVTRLTPENRREIKLLTEGGVSGAEIARTLRLDYEAITNFRSGLTFRERSASALARTVISVPGIPAPGNDDSYVKHVGCSVDGCAEEHASKGYCAKHYKQTIAGRDPSAPHVCEECGDTIPDQKLSHARFCNHSCQMKWHRKHGAYSAEAKLANGHVCSIESCGRPLHANGLCSAHDMRRWRFGDPNKELGRFRGEGCVVEGCEAKHFSFGYCSKHYHQNVTKIQDTIRVCRESCAEYGETPLVFAQTMVPLAEADDEHAVAHEYRLAVHVFEWEGMRAARKTTRRDGSG